VLHHIEFKALEFSGRSYTRIVARKYRRADDAGEEKGAGAFSDPAPSFHTRTAKPEDRQRPFTLLPSIRASAEPASSRSKAKNPS